VKSEFHGKRANMSFLVESYYLFWPFDKVQYGKIKSKIYLLSSNFVRTAPSWTVRVASRRLRPLPSIPGGRKRVKIGGWLTANVWAFRNYFYQDGKR
jgi:hypothetical protein